MSTLARRGVMLVLSSPSGAGKTSIARALHTSERELQLSVSVTTRTARPGEDEGVHYYFRSLPEVEAMIAGGDLLEYAHVFDHVYGTPRGPVETALASGTDVLFDIDWQGTRQLAAVAREDLVSIFILPPTLGDLEKRLRGRGQDSEAIIAKRMVKATSEIAHWNEYDYVVVNHDLATSIEAVRSILNVERRRRHRQVGLVKFANSLLA